MTELKTVRHMTTAQGSGSKKMTNHSYLKSTEKSYNAERKYSVADRKIFVSGDLTSDKNSRM